MIAANLRAYIVAQSAITSLVEQRVYPVILPQKVTMPAISYREDSHDLDETFDGQTGLTESFYMVDAFGSTYSEATDVGDAIRAALKNHKGDLGGIGVSKISLVNGPETVYEDEVEAYRQTQTFSIWHNEV